MISGLIVLLILHVPGTTILSLSSTYDRHPSCRALVLFDLVLLYMPTRFFILSVVALLGILEIPAFPLNTKAKIITSDCRPSLRATVE